MAATGEHKYAVPGIHPDQLNIDFGDGVPQGPGPGHYDSLADAFTGAADWLWIYAEASRQIGRGLASGKEWDCFIFKDGSTQKYGFTTPEQHGHDYTNSAAARVHLVNKRLAGRGAHMVRGYIHSHPSGPFAFGFSVEVFSRIQVDGATGYITGDLAAAYLFSPQDIRVGLLTPSGAVKTVRLLASVKEEIRRVSQPLEDLNVPSPAVRRILERPAHQVFVEETLRPPLGRNWAPGKREWRARAIEAVARELMHYPQNRREEKRFERMLASRG